MTARDRLLPVGLCAIAACAGGCAGPVLRHSEGFRTPECVVVDPATGTAYVSNIAVAEAAGTDEEKYWGFDGTGFISRLRPGGTVEQLRWRDSAPKAGLNAPKGMCVLDGTLYVADITRVLEIPLAGPGKVRVIPIIGAQKLNDAATDGTAVYVSDTGGGKVYRLGEDGDTAIKAPEGVNGITFHQGRMYAVSWSLHEVFELDPAGKEAPRPFGLAGHFAALDGIEVLDGGTFLVSDFQGNKVCTISPDRTAVRTYVELTTPADIGIDRERKLLYVPLLAEDRVVVCDLPKE